MKRSDFPTHPAGDEERLTAWIDGELTGREQAGFEASLDQGGLTRAQAEAERAAARQLGALLRQHAPAPGFQNGEAFNHQILRRIEAETPAPAWPWQRLLWSGTGGLAVAALLFFAFVAPALHRLGPPPEYYAQILNATTSDPSISAGAVHSNEENVTVLWIDGLDYVPAQKVKN